ncbi:MAG: hypothetical protein AAF496_05595 [Pseudomonadota bacterium]
MRRSVTRFLMVMMSLLLVLTGQSVASSRGMDMSAGQMVLCTGAGPVVVYIDENGQPTSPPHYCPDYALTLLGAIAVPQVPLPAAPRQARSAPLRHQATLFAQPMPGKPARAPPFPV